MKLLWNGRVRCLAVALLAVLAIGVASPARGQLILNESNTVDADKFLEVAFNEVQILIPYEGYDYGVVPYSGRTNPPDGPNPGNPYPDDLDTGMAGNQTTLPSGWNGTTGWGRILANGGDWFELVVTEDHSDLRGFTLYAETDDPDARLLPNGVAGDMPSERHFIKFTNSKAWADLRAGTIVTLSEDSLLDEIRDDYPYDFPTNGQADTGHDYDLSTNLAFNPFTDNDWHIHFHVDEDVTKDEQMATEHFEAGSDVKGHNRLWRMAIFNASNTSITAVAKNPDAQKTNPAGANYLDLTTGKVQDFIGENGSGISGFGANIPGGAGGVNGNEMVALVGDPASNKSRGFYEDVDWSSFGMPNVFNLAQAGNPNAQDDTKLGGTQNFSVLRNPVLANTYDWVAAGTANFSTAANWRNSDTAAAPANGPEGTWTAQLANNAGGNRTALVSGSQSIKHGVVMATTGSMTLSIQADASLDVGSEPSRYDYNGNGKVDAADYVVWRNTLGQNIDLRADGNDNDMIDQGDYLEWKGHYGEMSPPATGRLLVMGGGTLHVDGRLSAGIAEAFSGGTVSGSGTIQGDLRNSGGAVAPGNGAGVLGIDGDFAQSAQGTLEIELGGTATSAYDLLAVGGSASLLGTLEISLIGGFTPSVNNTFTILTADNLTEDLTLGGAAGGFELIVNSTSLVLRYNGIIASGAGSDRANVPEPASAVLLIAGLAGVIALRRR